jgi:hypothetical protein
MCWLFDLENAKKHPYKAMFIHRMDKKRPSHAKLLGCGGRGLGLHDLQIMSLKLGRRKYN